jgi:deferrochelatase/peroxidase EfeB
LGLNGSFLAFRVLKQDVHGFETFLNEKSHELGVDKELLAAKICGRWRNGVPLAISADKARPDAPIADDDLNFFDYKPTERYPQGYNDARGFRCPVGSHIRRVNPRSATIAGGGGNLRRLVRRGLPYGPAYDPADPDDGHERGLLGMFICVSLKDQFEFVMSEWVNDGLFAGGLGRTKCPMLGNNTPQESKFVIPVEGSAPHVIKGFSRFVTTRGSAYCFLPGIAALQFMAGLP